MQRSWKRGEHLVPSCQSGRRPTAAGFLGSFIGRIGLRWSSCLTAGGPCSLKGGRTCHLVVSAVAACNRLVTLECATIGLKNGLSLGDMATVLDASSGYNSAIARVLPALETAARTADVDLGSAVKELKLAVELGKRSSAPMLVANVACATFEGAANVLGNDATIDAMSRVYEAAAGVAFGARAK